MGHPARCTIVYVGLGRLPQPLVAAAPTVAVELEVRYSAPFASAVRVAVQAAARRALADATDSEALADRESLQVQSRQPGRADPERHGREPLQRAGEPTVALS